jgi:hypothetical protein
MNKALLAMAGIVLAGGLSGPVQAQEEFFSDNFTALTRDGTKWRDSIYLDSNARLRIVNGKVLFSRDNTNMDALQQVQWDSKFVRLYNNNDFLQIGATVRIPDKIRSGNGVYSLGIGLVSGGTVFVELAVEDSAEGRAFNLFFENIDTALSDTVIFDAPQNVTTFDLVLAYSAATDTLAFYWSIPGVNKLFRIGPLIDFASIGGVAPRRLRPYIIGVIYNDEALVPESWRVNLDNFYALREDVP